MAKRHSKARATILIVLATATFATLSLVTWLGAPQTPGALASEYQTPPQSSSQLLQKYDLSTPAQTLRSQLKMQIDGDDEAMAELQALIAQQQLKAKLETLEIDREVISDGIAIVFTSYRIHGRTKKEALAFARQSADQPWLPLDVDIAAAGNPQLLQSIAAWQGQVPSKPATSENPLESPTQVTEGKIKVIQRAIQHFKLDMRMAPTTLHDLLVEPDVAAVAGRSRWRGPYLESGKTLVDGWGSPFHLKQTEEGPLRIVSAGEDGALGTSDDATGEK